MQYMRWFDEIGMQDVPLVGGKNASLGEMVRALAPTGERIPNGFAVTAQAYRAILDASPAGMALRDALTGLDADNSLPSVDYHLGELFGCENHFVCALDKSASVRMWSVSTPGTCAACRLQSGVVQRKL